MRGPSGPSVANRVLPDGCSDIIVGLTDLSGATVVGTMRTAEVYSLSGSADLFGVRFRPGCGLPFLGVPLSEITDQRVPLDALWRDAARLLDDAAPAARLSHAERLLTERVGHWLRDRRADDALATRAIALLRQSRGGASIRSVASALGVGERRLERAFDRDVGINPKAFDRVLRLRRVTRQIDALVARNRPIAWTSVAFDAGYADQSHLIREFRALAGVTPASYAVERHGVGFVQYDDAGSI
jgi:AraC-like DNA-binding protein